MINRLKNIAPKKMEIFIALCQTGNFNKAARMLGTTATLVKGNIDTIERNLDAHLYLHKRKEFILTEEGEIFFEISKKMMNFVEENLHDAMVASTSRQEILNIACTMWDSEYLMPSVLKEFVKKYPNVRCEIFSGSEYIGFNDAKTDCVIGPSLKDRNDIEQSMILEFSLQLFASKEYLRKHGNPKNIEDIKNHNLVIHQADFPINNKLYRNNTISAVVNNYVAILNIVDNDFGMGLLPEKFVWQYKEYLERIIPVVPDFSERTDGVFFLTRKEGGKRELLDFLKVLVKKHYDKLEKNF